MKIFVDSVIYTPEGITKHVREETKQLKKLGHQIMLRDTNYNSLYDDEGILKTCYEPIDIVKDEYVYYSVQPPIREMNVPFSLYGQRHHKNLVYFLAFESLLPKQWVEIINMVSPKLILVPSEYNKKLFIKSGVLPTIPIKILPHGVHNDIDPKPLNLNVGNKFKFLWSGTPHNSRKGLKIIYKAWKELKDEDDIILILKISKIYGIDRDSSFMLEEMKTWKNVYIIDSILTDNEMMSLLKTVDCYISTSLSEGFGMQILEAMNVGTPVITSDAGGNMDFCNNKNSLILKTDGKVNINEYVYNDIEWNISSYKDLIKNIKKIVKDKKLREKLSKEGLKTAKDYDWKIIGKKLENYFNEIISF